MLGTTARICLGVAATGSGLMQVINATFVRLMLTPAWLPGASVWAVCSGAILVVIGAALIAGWRVRLASFGLALLLLAPLLLRLSEALGSPLTGFLWTNPAKALALAGGTVLVAVDTERVRGVVAWLFGIFLLICGAQHFAYAAFVDAMVPAWIPPGPRFWTFTTAVLLLAGGLGLLRPRLRRAAGLLSGVMILLWILLLHIPRSVETRTAFELAGVFEALALVGVAWWLVKDTPPRATSRSG